MLAPSTRCREPTEKLEGITFSMGLDALRNRMLKWMPDFLRKRGWGGWGGGRKGRTVHLGGLVEHGHINCTSKESTSTYYILCQHGKVDV